MIKNPILFVLVLLFSAPLLAEVYVVDMQKIITTSDQGVSAKKSLEAEYQKKKEQLDQKSKKLMQDKKDLQQQAAVIKKEKLEEKVKVLRKQETDLTQELQKYQQDFTRDNNNKIGKIIKDAEAVIAGIAKNKGYPIVIEKNQRVVLFAEDRLDLTAQVLKGLNKK